MWDTIKLVLAWALFGISMLALFNAFINRFNMKVHYGGARYEACRVVTMLLGLRSQRIVQLRLFKWLLFGVGAVMLAEHIQHEERPWHNFGNLLLPMFAFMVGCVQFFGQARPGAILMLGSGMNAVTLHERCASALFPHRPVSLLEIDNVPRIPGDVFRVTIGDWHETVWRFARSVLVIVVDLRTMTSAVTEELDFIIREQLQFKTMLLLHPGANLPDVRLTECCVVATEEACVAKLKKAFTSPTTLPSDHRPLRLT